MRILHEDISSEGYIQLDKTAIKEDADLLVVAEELGWDVVSRGQKKLILCPHHNDHNLGSCYITEKKYECYTCHKQGDVFAFVQAVRNVKFLDAVKIVADICGGSDQYLLSGDACYVSPDSRFISKEDQLFIGLFSDPVFTIVGIEYDYDSLPELREQGFQIDFAESADGDVYGYLLKERVLSNPLYSLYKEDIQSYRQLIDDHCAAKISLLQLLTAAPDSTTLPTEYRKVVTTAIKNTSKHEWLSVIAKMIQRAQKISYMYGAGTLKQRDVECAETSHLVSRSTGAALAAVAANDMWKQKTEAPF